jgi:hypothetical protein
VWGSSEFELFEKVQILGFLQLLGFLGWVEFSLGMMKFFPGCMALVMKL